MITLLLIMLSVITASGQLSPTSPFTAFARPAAGGGSSLTTSLIAHWKLNEASGSRSDSVGSNTLTDNNTVPGVTGKIGDCADFEFINNEYLSITDNTDLSLGADTDFTWAFWINAESLGVHGAYHPIVTKTPASGGNNIAYEIYWYSSTLRFYVANGSSGTEVTTAFTTTGAWVFVVAWHSSTDNKLYIQLDNGTPAEIAWSGGTQDEAGSMEIGRFPQATSFYWDGLIDSVSFWKRTLTSGERTSLYNGGSGLDYPF